MSARLADALALDVVEDVRGAPSDYLEIFRSAELDVLHEKSLKAENSFVWVLCPSDP